MAMPTKGQRARTTAAIFGYSRKAPTIPVADAPIARKMP